MKRPVILRPEVADDLHSIAIYLEQSSTAIADRFINSFFASLDGLAEMPGKGSPKSYRSRRLAGVRSWSVPGFRNFLILYRIMPEGIDVMAVTHGARDLRNLLHRRV